jgi:hypothetical protein
MEIYISVKYLENGGLFGTVERGVQKGDDSYQPSSAAIRIS